MFLTMIMFAALFMFGFISIAQYTDVQQRVRAWLSSKSTTQKVKPMEEPPLQQQVKVKQLDFEAVVDTESKKKDELKRVFETFDKDGDGFITRQELREAMKGVGLVLDESEVEEMVEKMDGNGDGLIDLSEFCGSFGEVGKEEDEGVLREAFEVFDGNKDGVISVEELGMVLKSLGLKQGLKLQDCEDMIRKVDMDGDGTINFSEFKKMMRAGGSLFVSSS